jgi:hypothetical protein
MMKKVLAVAMVLVMVAALGGCATESGYYSPGRSAGAGLLGGAATGAALGSIIGAATGSAATGAWVGAAAGALVGTVGGYLYAEHRNSMMRSSAAAAQSYNYTGSGNVVNIENTYVNPSAVRPGQQVNLGMTYTILTPGNAPTSVTLVREVRLGNSLVGQPYQTTVTNANGTFSDNVGYNVPANAPPGNYTVTSRVLSSYGSAQRDNYFSVQ